MMGPFIADVKPPQAQKQPEQPENLESVKCTLASNFQKSLAKFGEIEKVSLFPR